MTDTRASLSPPVTVTLSFGEPQTGVWCPSCLLPSAVTWPLTGEPAGFIPYGLSVTVCQDCGQEVG